MSPILRPTSDRQLTIGLTVLRVVVGAVFLAHGLQKLFSYGLDGVAGAFGQMGIPGAAVLGPVVAFAELFGGIALVAGLLTRVAGFGLALIMLGALWFAHLSAGFFLPNGYEYVLTLAAAAATLGITGAGTFSVDGLVARRQSLR